LAVAASVTMASNAVYNSVWSSINDPVKLFPKIIIKIGGWLKGGRREGNVINRITPIQKQERL